MNRMTKFYSGNSVLNPPVECTKQESLIIKEHLDEPGPGAYYNSSVFSAFKIQTKPSGFQFFNSKNERFKDSNNFVPGPGYYESEPQILKEKKEDKSFISHDQRFKPADSKNLYSVPGLNKITELQYKSNPLNIESIDCSAIFGSGMKKFQSKSPANVIFNF